MKDNENFQTKITNETDKKINNVYLTHNNTKCGIETERKEEQIFVFFFLGEEEED